MKVKIIFIMVVLVLIFSVITYTYGRPKPEAKLPIGEVDILKYEPIDFKEALAKTEFASVSTERDPFKSPFVTPNKFVGQAEEGAIEILSSDSLKLIGIVNGPDGPVALIRSATEKRIHTVKQDSVLGECHVTKISDKEVILNFNGLDTVLRLGGDKNGYK